MMIPKLRFKADDGGEFPEWEKFSLGDVTLEFKSGKNIKASLITSNGDYPVYGGNGLRGYTNNFNHDGTYAIIGRQGALCGNMTLVSGKTYLTEHAIAVNGNDKNNTLFLYYLLITMRLGQYSDQGAQPGLAVNKLLKLTNMFPSLPEQQKIASFLSTIDEIIQSTESELTAWQERKKGVMQKIFNREVRFKADDGSEFPEWEEKRLGELFTRIVEKNRTDLSPLTIIQGQGTVRRDESDRRIAYDKKGLKNYKAVKKDDFIVHLRSFEGGLEIANQDGIVSPAYHVYRGSSNVCSQFYYPYFRSNNFIKGRLAICVTGVRDGKNIEMDTFDELLLPCPSLPEQQKIADCLSSLDDAINQIKAELSAWKEFKKGLLQQMFV